jgi:hypothetical protein
VDADTVASVALAVAVFAYAGFVVTLLRAFVRRGTPARHRLLIVALLAAVTIALVYAMVLLIGPPLILGQPA